MRKLAIITALLIMLSGVLCDHCTGIPVWNTNTHYNTGDYVQISGLLYQAASANFCRNPCYPEAPWDHNPWVLINTCIVDCSNAPIYSQSVEYAKDAIVKYSGYLYIALWGGNKGNRPDLNSGDWGAWKKLFKCNVCVTIIHDCATVNHSTGTVDAQGRICVDAGTTVTFQAIAQQNARVIGSDTKTLIVTQDIVVTFDCEYRVIVGICGTCNVDPGHGPHDFWPSDHSSLYVTVTPPIFPDRECKVVDIKIDGISSKEAILIDIQENHVIETFCECQYCVDISGDCVNTPNQKTCEYKSDQIRLEVEVEAPIKPGYTCVIDSITVDGNIVNAVVFDPLDSEHQVITDCSCVAECPKFYGCNNTPEYNNAQSQVYHGCDCVKQTFDCPNGSGTQIVFCAPENTTIKCDQNIYDGHLVWQGHAICSGTIVNYVIGKAYSGGSIVNEANNCYVAKWWTQSKPSTHYGLYQDWRYIGICDDLII